jgi:thiol:disulfide interchange protein DsbD
MKSICILALLLLTRLPQADEAVKWSFSAVRLDDSTYELHLTALLGDGWHTYSHETPPGGPVPTTISFINNPLLSLQGAIREEGKLNKHFEPLFGVNVLQYSGKVDFVQRLQLKHPVKTVVKGKIRFMVCNDHECLPPAVKEFDIVL